LFDANYYYLNYTDVQKAGTNPLLHFIRYGWREGRNPSKSFDTNFYLSQNSDVRDAGINPLLHYIRCGKREQRAICSDQGGVRRSFGPPRLQMSHNEDHVQQLTPEESSVINLLKKVNFFDPAWYLAQNEEVQSSGADPWLHFVRYGINENRQPNPFFDPVWYLNFNKDVRNAGHNPLLHYLRHGVNEGRKAYNTASISILAVEHCTNRCQHCSTCSPFANKISYPASAFFPWLDMLENVLVPFEYIAITGGEPFLHHDIGALVHDLRERYPSKVIGISTNFFWANENMIRMYAPMIRQLNGLLISLYPNLVNKLGSLDRFDKLVNLVRKLCPEIAVEVRSQSHFLSWELHMDKREVKDTCGTSDCYVLRSDGKISHCSIGVGLENRPEYQPVVNTSKERLFDLSKGIEGFKSWCLKYPFDLCFHCTMWRKISVPWSENRG